MSGLCENCLADFYISALLKAVKSNLLSPKFVKVSVVQKSARQFSDGVDSRFLSHYVSVCFLNFESASESMILLSDL